MLERAEELEKIKKQQRETGEGLAALRQRFEDQGVAAAESAAEVRGLLQQLLAGSGTRALVVAAAAAVVAALAVAAAAGGARRAVAGHEALDVPQVLHAALQANQWGVRALDLSQPEPRHLSRKLHLINLDAASHRRWAAFSMKRLV